MLSMAMLINTWTIQLTKPQTNLSVIFEEEQKNFCTYWQVSSGQDHQFFLQSPLLTRKSILKNFSGPGKVIAMVIYFLFSSFSARSTFCDSKFGKLTTYPPAQVFLYFHLIGKTEFANNSRGWGGVCIHPQILCSQFTNVAGKTL